MKYFYFIIWGSIEPGHACGPFPGVLEMYEDIRATIDIPRFDMDYDLVTTLEVSEDGTQIVPDILSRHMTATVLGLDTDEYD
jgi:hypothetical protein